MFGREKLELNSIVKILENEKKENYLKRIKNYFLRYEDKNFLEKKYIGILNLKELSKKYITEEFNIFQKFEVDFLYIFLKVGEVYNGIFEKLEKEYVVINFGIFKGIIHFNSFSKEKIFINKNLEKIILMGETICEKNSLLKVRLEKIIKKYNDERRFVFSSNFFDLEYKLKKKK